MGLDEISIDSVVVCVFDICIELVRIGVITNCGQRVKENSRFQILLVLLGFLASDKCINLFFSRKLKKLHCYVCMLF